MPSSSITPFQNRRIMPGKLPIPAGLSTWQASKALVQPEDPAHDQGSCPSHYRQGPVPLRIFSLSGGPFRRSLSGEGRRGQTLYRLTLDSLATSISASET